MGCGWTEPEDHVACRKHASRVAPNGLSMGVKIMVMSSDLRCIERQQIACEQHESLPTGCLSNDCATQSVVTATDTPSCHS